MNKNICIPAILFALLLLILPLIQGATIHGVIYDMDLTPAKNAIVKINSIPEQTYVAINGNFSFNLNPGNYSITAYYMENNDLYIAQQEIKITSEGSYISDLILFPDLEFEKNLTNINLDVGNIQFNSNNDNNTTTNDVNNRSSWIYGIILAIIVFILVLIVIFWSIKSAKKNSDENSIKKNEQDIKANEQNITKRIQQKNEFEKRIPEKDIAEQITEFIKEEHGRVNQKDIRKQFPMSEAKISLIIKELEAKGFVQKIKKGKGNIIILTKK